MATQAQELAFQIEYQIQLLLHDDRGRYIAINGGHDPHGSLTQWFMFDDGSVMRLCSTDVFGTAPDAALVATYPLMEAERDAHYEWLMSSVINKPPPP